MRKHFRKLHQNREKGLLQNSSRSLKVKWSGVGMTAGTGKIGGQVATTGRYGSVVRTKVTPVNRNTAAQSTARSNFTGVSQSWKALTDAQRATWNNAAPNWPRTDQFGDTITLSGATLYQALNNTLVTAGQAMITTAPTPADVFAFTSASVAVDNSSQSVTITFAASPIPANMAVFVFASDGMSPGRNFAKTQLRKITQLAAAATSPAAVSAAYITKFGAVGSVGQRVFIRLVPVNLITGQQGQSLQFSTIIVT